MNCPRCKTLMQEDCAHDLDTDVGLIHVQCHYCPWCELRYQAVPGGEREKDAVIRFVQAVAGPCDDPMCDACQTGVSTEVTE